MLHSIAAYAEKQAHLSKQLAWQCAEYWLPALKERGISPKWEHYPITKVVTPLEHVVSSVVDNVHEQGEEDLQSEDFERFEEKDDDS